MLASNCLSLFELPTSGRLWPSEEGGGHWPHVDNPGCACSLGLLSTWGLGYEQHRVLGRFKDDLRVPVACVEGAEPSISRFKGLWPPQGAVVEARGPSPADLKGGRSQRSQR